MTMEFNEEINDLYSCSKWSKTLDPKKAVEQHLEILYKKSLKARESLPNKIYSYKENEATEESHYIMFNATNTSKTLLIYIHGGFWQILNLRSSLFMADYFVENDINFAALGYNLSPGVSLEIIVEEIRLGIKIILQNHLEMERVVICGHSAGAHLALMSVVFDGYKKSLNFSENDIKRISGLVLISGIYDIRPICHTDNNENLRLTESSAWTLSPLRCIKHLRSLKVSFKVLIIVAKFDSPAFIEQSRNLHLNICKKVNENCSSYIFVDGKDHFEVVHDIGDPNYELNKAILHFIKT